MDAPAGRGGARCSGTPRTPRHRRAARSTPEGRAPRDPPAPGSRSSTRCREPPTAIEGRIPAAEPWTTTFSSVISCEPKRSTPRVSHPCPVARRCASDGLAPAQPRDTRPRPPAAHPAADSSGVQPQRPVALVRDLAEVVRCDHHRHPVRPHRPDALHALGLERHIADRERLVDEQQLGIELGEHPEGQPQPHAVAVDPYGRVGKILDLGELEHRGQDLARPGRVKPSTTAAVIAFSRPVSDRSNHDPRLSTETVRAGTPPLRGSAWPGRTPREAASTCRLRCGLSLRRSRREKPATDTSCNAHRRGPRRRNSRRAPGQRAAQRPAPGRPGRERLPYALYLECAHSSSAKPPSRRLKTANDISARAARGGHDPEPAEVGHAAVEQNTPSSLPRVSSWG